MGDVERKCELEIGKLYIAKGHSYVKDVYSHKRMKLGLNNDIGIIWPLKSASNPNGITRESLAPGLLVKEFYRFEQSSWTNTSLIERHYALFLVGDCEWLTAKPDISKSWLYYLERML